MNTDTPIKEAVAPVTTDTEVKELVSVPEKGKPIDRPTIVSGGAMIISLFSVLYCYMAIKRVKKAVGK